MNAHERQNLHSERHSVHDTGEGLHRVERTWHPTHVEAGYHLATWGAVPHPEHSIIGTYNCVVNDKESSVTVSYIDGLTGPEFQVQFEDGMTMTVVDDACAVAYLLQYGVDPAALADPSTRPA